MNNVATSRPEELRPPATANRAIDPKDIPLVRGMSSLRFLEAPGVGYEGFQLNTAGGPLASGLKHPQLQRTGRVVWTNPPI